MLHRIVCSSLSLRTEQWTHGAPSNFALGRSARFQGKQTCSPHVSNKRVYISSGGIPLDFERLAEEGSHVVERSWMLQCAPQERPSLVEAVNRGQVADFSADRNHQRLARDLARHDGLRAAVSARLRG